MSQIQSCRSLIAPLTPKNIDLAGVFSMIFRIVEQNLVFVYEIDVESEIWTIHFKIFVVLLRYKLCYHFQIEVLYTSLLDESFANLVMYRNSTFRNHLVVV